MTEEVSAFGNLAEAANPASPVTGLHITEQEYEVFKEDFKKCDTSGNGFITRNEVKNLVKIQVTDGKDGAIDKIIEEFDYNEDGHISVDEYLNCILGKGWVVSNNPPLPGQEAVDAVGAMREKFDAIDKDASGFVDAAELGEALKEAEFKDMLEKSGIYTAWVDGAIYQLETGAADKKVTWNEFLAKVGTPAQIQVKQDVRAKFDAIAGADGKVSRRELSKALKQDKHLIRKIKDTHPIVSIWAHGDANSTGIDLKGRKWLMDKLDMNDDGKLSFEEFDDLLSA